MYIPCTHLYGGIYTPLWGSRGTRGALTCQGVRFLGAWVLPKWTCISSLLPPDRFVGRFRRDKQHAVSPARLRGCLSSRRMVISLFCWAVDQTPCNADRMRGKHSTMELHLQCVSNLKFLCDFQGPVNLKPMFIATSLLEMCHCYKRSRFVLTMSTTGSCTLNLSYDFWDTQTHP